MDDNLKQNRLSQRGDTRQKITLVEQAGNRILVSAAGAAAIGGAFAGSEGALVGAIVGAFVGFFLGHDSNHSRRHVAD